MSKTYRLIRHYTHNYEDCILQTCTIEDWLGIQKMFEVPIRLGYRVNHLEFSITYNFGYRYQITKKEKRGSPPKLITQGFVQSVDYSANTTIEYKFEDTKGPNNIYLRIFSLKNKLNHKKSIDMRLKLYYV